MSRTKTVELVTDRDMIARLRVQVSGLKIEKKHLEFIVGRCRFEDGLPELCPKCDKPMRGGGDFAKCGSCGRTFERLVKWNQIWV